MTSCIWLTADTLYNTYAINNAKEFADNAGSIDQLRNENIELNKLNESMKTELETAKKALAQAEQSLAAQRQKSKDTLRDIQDRLDKRLDESLAIDNQLLSKFLLKNSILLSLCLSHFIIELGHLQLRRVMATSCQRKTGLTGFWSWEKFS